MRGAMELEPELLLQEARENVEAAQSYRRELGHRLEGLREARRQIKESASQTRDVLKQHFNDLKGTLGKLLDERLVTLLQEVDAIEQETIKPLDDCQKLIEHGVNTAEDLVREGEIAMRGGVGEENEKLWSFTKKASHIQLDSLPEVPLLVDVPCLSAQLDDSILNIVKDHIFKHGTVASRPPVQIEELIEKPGGIIVRWCKVDDDFTAQDYRLQFRKCTSNHFEDVYVGSETEFIVLHIDPNVDYQFRVCARGDGRQEWSPWSVPQIGHSTLVPHEWTAGFEGYSLSSRRNIALRNDSESSGVLYSRAPTYFCGQTLTFRLKTIKQPDHAAWLMPKFVISCSFWCLSVALQVLWFYSSKPPHSHLQWPPGAVFVNGKEMTNQLPAVTSGSTVTFDIEAVTLGTSNNNEGGHFKLRVTISSNNREVVFDWLLDQSCGSLYFGCSFFYPGWKVLVF
ncbi:PREDICTED: cytokine receptor-like factor 3 [Colobus angolensis palliatus]|uniref:cytokine receptor-like factor 3 n=1 Tax=Colobus angolensis palliatus TaxID=336983 RepID=UPI0005F3E0C7|nr:PREDICTED: cytokine receptor-like factor 3 [Colobus angolensis palliatus]